MSSMKKKYGFLSVIQQEVRKQLVGSIRRLMGIPWLRSFALKVLNRLPFVKHRLQRLLASVPQNITPIKRDVGNVEDYNDMFPPVFFAGRSTYQDIDTIKRDEPKIGKDIRKITLTGHFNGSYSLASVNRHIVNRCLEDCPEMHFCIQPYEGEIASKVFDTPKGVDEVARLNSLLWDKKANVEGAGNVSIYHHYPLITPNADDDTSIALFFWEESNVPDDIVRQLNEQYSGVLVTTWFVKKVLIDSGCVLPIQVVPLPLESYPHPSDRVLKKENGSSKVTFLHVSSCFPRKGVDLLLEAFDLAAEQDESIHLVIKTFPNPHNQIHTWVQQYVRPHLQERIDVIESDMSAKEMALLYQSADAVVLPTRGEGLNLPAIEAGFYKKPLIVTGYGAHMDFVNQDNAYLLDYRFSSAHTHVNDSRSVWTEVSVPKLAETLILLSIKIRENDISIKEKSGKLHENVKKIFFDKNATQGFLQGVWQIQQYKKRNLIKQCDGSNQGGGETLKIKVDLFSTWGEECGIAEYSQSLIRSMLPENALIEVHHPIKRRLFSNVLDDALSFNSSWVYGGDGPDLEGLQFDGQVLWLQHHFAFYGLTQKLSEGIEFQNRQGKLTYITLHTTRPLLSYEKNNLHIAVKCLGLFERIFVHAVDDLNTLKRLGLVDNVMLMPHGVKASLVKKGLEKQEGKMPLIVGSFGFLLPHKGIDVLIEGFSLALQNQKIPANSRLKLVNAVRPDGTSFYEKERCVKLVTQLGLSDNVEWFSDFLPIETCEEVLSSCNAVILPYQFTLESCSGAVRNAIVSCHHVATTPAPIFDEVREITHALEGYSAEHIEQFLSAFSEQAESNDFDVLLVKREKWLVDHSWPMISDRHINLFMANKVDRGLNKMEKSSL